MIVMENLVPVWCLVPQFLIQLNFKLTEFQVHVYISFLLLLLQITTNSVV